MLTILYCDIVMGKLIASGIRTPTPQDFFSYPSVLDPQVLTEGSITSLLFCISDLDLEKLRGFS